MPAWFKVTAPDSPHTAGKKREIDIGKEKARERHENEHGLFHVFRGFYLYHGIPSVDIDDISGCRAVAVYKEERRFLVRFGSATSRSTRIAKNG